MEMVESFWPLVVHHETADSQDENVGEEVLTYVSLRKHYLK